MAFKLDSATASKIREGLDALVECREICNKSTNCGYDFDAIDRMEQALRQRLLKLKEEFGVKVRRE